MGRVGGWYLWWNCWHQKEYIWIYVYIYISILIYSLKSETMRDLHLNLKPIQEVDTGRTRNHLKKEEEAQLRQRYQDAYKRGREREKEGKERALREEYLFPRKSMLGHRLLRSGCWIWPLETVLDGPYLWCNSFIGDEHGMGWSGRKRVSVALEKFVTEVRETMRRSWCHAH